MNTKKTNAMKNDATPDTTLSMAHAAMTAAIFEEGAESMDGPPPKSAAERSIQKNLEKYYKSEAAF